MPAFTTANAGTSFTVNETVTGTYEAFYASGSTVKINGISVSGITLSVVPPEGGSSVTLQASGTYNPSVVGNPTLKHVSRNFAEDPSPQTTEGFGSVNPSTRLVYSYTAPNPVTATFEYKFGLPGSLTTETVTQQVIPDYSFSSSALSSYI